MNLAAFREHHGRSEVQGKHAKQLRSRINMKTFKSALSQMRPVRAWNSLMKLRVVWFLRISPSRNEGYSRNIGSGVMLGHPVVDVKATLLRWFTYHDVDSELAFIGRLDSLKREGIKQANPILLEPVAKVEVTTPEDFR